MTGERVAVLAGVRVVELGGMGPGPFAGMMLADHGAEVTVLKRPDYVRRMYEAGASSTAASRPRWPTSSRTRDAREPWNWSPGPM
jgi:crotonobetainyl-CoA:carnitine CoA-transferase CaiB-like acyl-CoA transferase